MGLFQLCTNRRSIPGVSDMLPLYLYDVIGCVSGFWAVHSFLLGREEFCLSSLWVAVSGSVDAVILV